MVYPPCSRLSSASHSAICSGVEALEVVFSAGGEGLQSSPTRVLVRRRRVACTWNGLALVDRRNLCTGWQAWPLVVKACLSRSSRNRRLRSQPLKSIPFLSHLHEVEQRTDLDSQPMTISEKSDDLRVRGGRSRSSQVGNLCLEGGEL
jgi:hypothetical protein